MFGMFKSKIKDAAKKAIGANSNRADKLRAEPSTFDLRKKNTLYQGWHIVEYIERMSLVRNGYVTTEGPFYGRYDNRGNLEEYDKNFNSFLLFDTSSDPDSFHRKMHLIFIFDDNTKMSEREIIQKIKTWYFRNES